MKKYKLKHDYYYYNPECVYTIPEGEYLEYKESAKQYFWRNHPRYGFDKSNVENNPEWFEEVKETNKCKFYSLEEYAKKVSEKLEEVEEVGRLLTWGKLSAGLTDKEIELIRAYRKIENRKGN
jgi:hypothetical protein